ncbi:glycosyltransferase [Actinopolymorpha sp. B17G11]|uniref:glycosyltransferase n=1 Tax=Actinopolymorpha sp. B17G11 TaxID=3160861 RepID=UPI0032E37080
MALTGLFRHEWTLLVGGLVSLHVAVLALAVVSFRGVRYLIRAGRSRAPASFAKAATAETPYGAVGGSVWTTAMLAETRGHRAMEETCLRTGSTQLRDVLAFAATGGEYTYAEFESLLEGCREPVRRKAHLRILERLDVSWLLSMARVTALQPGSKLDQLNAATMYEIADWLDGSSMWKPVHCLVYLQLMFEMGHHSRVDTLIDRANLGPAVRPYVEADLVNPFAGSVVGDERAWLAVVNGLLAREGLEPIELAPAGRVAPFDRLYARARERVFSGPLVSVVMTTYCPDNGLDVAVRSILEQSWRSLELVIVDDGSPQDRQTALDRWEGVDERIKIVREVANRGTYPARNTGLDLARGEFVTFQDSDDWSHPRRIQRQVEPLIAQEHLLATRSTCVRVSDQLEFNQLGYLPTRPNSSSLMFRRGEVTDRVGYFDPVRKAADSEHFQRLLTVFGERVTDIDPAPLAVVRRRTASLSRSDFRPGWHAPARRAYRHAYAHWHRDIANGEASPFVIAGGLARAFPVPRDFRSRRETGAVRYDVAFAGDWRQHGSRQRALLEEARALLAQGFRVAVVPLEAMRGMTAAMLGPCEPVQAFLNEATVDQIALEEDADVGVLVIGDPEVLQFAPGGPVRLRAERVAIMVDGAPYASDGSHHRYELTRSDANVRDLFGKDAIWVPQAADLRRQLAPLAPADSLAGWDLPPFVDADAWWSPRDSVQNPRPVIGRHVGGDALEWPRSRESLLRCYPVDGENSGVDVRILGGADVPLGILGLAEPPPNWDVRPDGDIDPRQFLAGIDFFVYFPHPARVGAPYRAILEAMASGAVAVLPHAYAETFGDGALYCFARDVVALVRRLCENPTLYRRQSEEGRAFVRSQSGQERYVQAIRDLLTGTP